MKILFIDRDGVINKDPGGWTEHSYVTKWEDFHFLPGAKEAIKRLNDSGYDIIVISNQGGISKKLFSKPALDEITRKMLKDIEACGAKIKKVYYCLHQDSDKCDCRKPKIGMFRQAEAGLGIKLSGAYFVGDGKTDIEAGSSAGLKTILVLSGKTELDKVEEWEVRPDAIVKDLAEAADFIIKNEKGAMA